MPAPFPVIDAHAHLWGGTAERDAKTLMEMADRFGIEQVWVSSLFGGMDPSTADVDAGNAAATALAERDPRFRTWARVQPQYREHTLEVLETLVRDGPAIGVKVWIHPADSPEMDPLAERLAAWGRPLLIHAWQKAGGNYPGESTPQQVTRLAGRHRRLKILMAHLGGDFLHGCKAIAECENVWSDFSGTPCDRGTVPHAVSVLGARRVVFGTDAVGASFLNNLAKVLAEDLDEATCRRVLADNARELAS
jgi:hypothetical protein